MYKFKKIIILLAISILLIFTGCGGGSGDSTPVNDDNVTVVVDDPVIIPAENSVDMNLSEGTYFEFTWASHDSDYAQGGTTTYTDAHGRFVLTLAAPTLTNGMDVYPITKSGDFPSTVPLRWNYLAIDTDGSLLGSQTGNTFTKIYDAVHTTWQGGGFFINFSDDETVSSSSSTFTGTYNTLPAVRVGYSDSSGGCEYTLGITLCDDSSTNFSMNEYMKEGIGALGYIYSATYTYSSGGFYTSHTKNLVIELIETSLVPSDGSVLERPAWTELEKMPTPRRNFATAVLEGEIYIIGGYSDSLQQYVNTVEVYNPTTAQWRSAEAFPSVAANSRNKVSVVDNKINIYMFTENDSDIIYTFDAVNKWTTNISYSNTLGYNIKITPWAGNIIALPYGTTTVTSIPIFYQLSSSGEWFIYNNTLSNYNKWNSFEMVQLDNTLYLTGGFYLSDPTWNTWKTIGYAKRFDLINGESLLATPEMINPRRSGHTVITYNNKIYVMGGIGSDKSELNKVEVYDPVENTWTNTDAMFSPKVNGGAVVIDNKIYAIDENSMEVYTP